MINAGNKALNVGCSGTDVGPPALLINIADYATYVGRTPGYSQSHVYELRVRYVAVETARFTQYESVCHCTAFLKI